MILRKLRVAILAVFFVAGACAPMLYFKKDHAMHSYSNEWYGKGYFAGLIQFGVEGTCFAPISIIEGRRFDRFPWFEVYSVEDGRALKKLYTVHKRHNGKAIFVKFKGQLRRTPDGGFSGDQFYIGETIIEEITYYRVLDDKQYTALLKYDGGFMKGDERMPEKIFERIKKLRKVPGTGKFPGHPSPKTKKE